MKDLAAAISIILLFMTILALIAINTDPSPSNRPCPTSHTLKLIREGKLTNRGCIELPGDCQIIASTLQKEQILGTWACE